MLDMHSELAKVIESCNEECKKCYEDFQRADIDFSPSMCSRCKNGQLLHETLIRFSKAEKQWGEIDWNSSRWQDLYKS